MAYRVVSWDNFHMHDDDDAPDECGTFERADEALARAREIVVASLRHDAASAKSVEDLKNRYLSFGDVPSISGEPPVPFDPYRFVDEIASAVFAESRGNPSPS